MNRMLNDSSLQAEVDRIRWYHVIDLPGGIRTPGVYDPARKIHRYGIPDRLQGKSVLDIGAWDGWFSFEAERRGAERVLATDSFSWSGANWGSKQGFELARTVRRSRVEDKTIDVLDLSPNAVGTFDLVLFLGVLYHMRHPQLAIDRLASVCDDLLIIETHVDLMLSRRGALALYNEDDLQHDPTNYCGPNVAGMRTMLERAGFTRVTVQPPAGRVYNALKFMVTRTAKRGHRMVFHAHR
jgi:tRNA (mo5U34)-methyltransferase